MRSPRQRRGGSSRSGRLCSLMIPTRRPPSSRLCSSFRIQLRAGCSVRSCRRGWKHWGGASFSLYVGVDTLEQAFDELLLQAPVGMVLGASADVEDRVQLFAGQVSELETLEEDPGAYRVGELDVLRFGDSLHVKFP